MPEKPFKSSLPRTIPLSKRALAILRAHPKGFGLVGVSITHAFVRVCKQNGIKDLRFHDLRHEAISRLFEKGWYIQEVACIFWRS